MRDAVLLTIDSGVAEIRFNKPERLNALDRDLAEGFAAIAEKATTDPSVRVIVVAAAGRGFVAGGDLDYFRQSSDRGAAATTLIGPVHHALRILADAPQIVIGSLKGAVAGGGMSLALSLDLLIAADDTAFNFAYSRIGASPDCGGTWSLPRLVGVRKALEIALLSETIDAAEALRLGLVNRIVPLADLESETRKLAGRLASGAPVALGETKRLIRMSMQRDFSAQLEDEAETFARCAATRDFEEGIGAFFAKRRPIFSGH